MNRAIVLSFVVVLCGCQSDLFPASVRYVNQRVEDVDAKVSESFDAMHLTAVEAKASGVEDGTAALAGIKAGTERAKQDLPDRADWLSSIWTWLAGIFALGYRWLVGRWPVLGGLLEAIQGAAPAQQKRAAKRK